MPYIGELQTLTKLSMRHQICPGETSSTTILESTNMIIGRTSNVIIYILLTCMKVWSIDELATPSKILHNACQGNG